MKIPINKTRLKIAFLKLNPDLPGANELIDPVKWYGAPVAVGAYIRYAAGMWFAVTCRKCQPRYWKISSASVKNNDWWQNYIIEIINYRDKYG